MGSPPRGGGPRRSALIRFGVVLLFGKVEEVLVAAGGDMGEAPTWLAPSRGLVQQVLIAAGSGFHMGEPAPHRRPRHPRAAARFNRC